jgi:hypothetical protein
LSSSGWAIPRNYQGNAVVVIENFGYVCLFWKFLHWSVTIMLFWKIVVYLLILLAIRTSELECCKRNMLLARRLCVLCHLFQLPLYSYLYMQMEKTGFALIHSWFLYFELHCWRQKKKKNPISIC